MVSDGNQDSTEKVNEKLETDAYVPKLREYHIHIPSPEARMIDEQFINQPRRSEEWFKKLRISSPVEIFRRTINEREEISLTVASPAGIRRHFPIHVIRRINWHSVFSFCMEWLMHPMNIALLLWLICVAITGIMLGLLLLGLLNGAFPTTALRNHWIEIDNQILNALFTLMSVYQHPNLFHHLVLLFLWRSEDIIELRKIYCKNGAYRPREWAHVMVVVALLHVTCFAQYALCGLYWGYPSETRPELAENLFFAIGTAAPLIAAVYTVYSPLGREYEDSPAVTEKDCSQFDNDLATLLIRSEPRNQSDKMQSSKLGLKLYNSKVLVSDPEWVGGLSDCGGNMTVGYLSFFCTCCVFGWNMERLGFGNMYVHIVTFLLLCVAPFWIFNITAMNIHDYVLGDAIGTAGIILCVFGLIYGGFWRTQMRKKFKLPGNTFCCGSASLTDYFQWMFCWSCSLAQEVRTGDFYHIEDDSLYRRLIDGETDSQTMLPEDAVTSPPVQPLMKSEGRVINGELVAPLKKLEDSGIHRMAVAPLPNTSHLVEIEHGIVGVGISDTVKGQPLSPSMQTEGDSDPSKFVKLVKIVQCGLFMVVVYTLAASLIH